ncbi:PhoU domain-containing protein [Halobellus sp. EA9]|uniref:PhoU domain-containing protein n=1 Tax=Halobellus sp. EA9 TaxID=3421647 RepID=UPI003EBC1F82
MEIRKVQLSGGTTYTVSLPKFWAEDHDIEAGSLLYLYPNEDGSLLVEVADEHTETRRTKTVDVDAFGEDALRETLTALYLIGVDEVGFRPRGEDTSECERLCRAITADLTGFEILETSDTEVVIRNLLDADNVSIRKSTIRLRLFTDAMHEDAVTAVREDDVDLARGVIDRDAEADKLFRIVSRHFQRTLTDLGEVQKLSLTRAELFAYYYLARQLERIADHAEKMARVAIDQPHPPDEELGSELGSIGRDARSLIWDATEPILSDTDVGVAYDALAQRGSVGEATETLDRALYDSGHAPEAYRWGLLLDSLRRSAEYGANIAELAIQQHYR